MAITPNIQPTLHGNLIDLRPQKPEDFEGLYQAASDPLVWEQHPQKNRYQHEVFEKFFRQAQESKGALVIIDKNSKEIIGGSRYYDYNPEKNQFCIGYTFLARKYWGGATNKELKKLMLDHIFQFVDTVIFEIGATNIRSQKAITKIGAVFLKDTLRDNSPYKLYKIEKKDWD